MKIKQFIALILATSILTIIPEYSFAIKQATDKKSAFSYIKQDWWQNFNDPILNEYIIKSVQNNYDLQIAALKTDETIQKKNIIRAGEMPTFGIGAVPSLYKLPTLSHTGGIISFPIYANYEIDLFGKNRDKTKSMDKLIEISQQNERSGYLSVVSAVGSTYYNIVKLDKFIEIQEKITEERKEIYNLMKLSNEEGLISVSDTTNAHKALIKADSDLIELMKLREQMLNMLAVLIGDSPENSKNYKRIHFDDIVINKNIPEFIRSEIIENRPDYISAEKMLEKTGIDTRIAKKEFLPSFNILGLLSFNSTKYFSKLNLDNSFGLLSMGAVLPLFTGGAKIANLKLNKNKYKQALAYYQNTNIKAIQEVNNSLCDLKLDDKKYLKTLESYNDEKQNFHYNELKYKEGIISKLDYLQHQEALLVTEKMLVNDKISLFIDQISLYKSTAGEI